MSVWSNRRRGLYTFLFILILIILFGVPAFLLFYDKPTCFDNKQNGKEEGIDCGGNCALICQNIFSAPVVKWVREDKISQGLYNLGAYIENPNFDGEVADAKYMFRLYDQFGFIAERSGSIYIPPHKNTLAFQNAVSVGNRTPSKFEFKFTSPLVWEKNSGNDVKLTIIDKKIIDESTAPKVFSIIKNESLYDYGKVEVYAILYGTDKNGDEITVAFSRTEIDEIKAGQTSEAVFTWPSVFKNEINRIEIVPILLDRDNIAG